MNTSIEVCSVSCTGSMDKFRTTWLRDRCHRRLMKLKRSAVAKNDAKPISKAKPEAENETKAKPAAENETKPKQSI